MKIRDFLPILKEHGFTEDRVKGSHHQYKGIVDGQMHTVTLDFSQMGEEIQSNNLKSMIRQSGLSKKLFRH